MIGSDYCFRHNPKHRRSALAASAKGGLNRMQQQSFFEFGELNKPQDIQLLIEQTLESVITGQMRAKNPANTIGYLTRCWLDAYSQGEMEQRVAKLEQLIPQK